jgi:hypothetical protein
VLRRRRRFRHGEIGMRSRPGEARVAPDSFPRGDEQRAGTGERRFPAGARGGSARTHPAGQRRTCGSAEARARGRGGAAPLGKVRYEGLWEAVDPRGLRAQRRGGGRSGTMRAARRRRAPPPTPGGWGRGATVAVNMRSARLKGSVNDGTCAQRIQRRAAPPGAGSEHGPASPGEGGRTFQIGTRRFTKVMEKITERMDMKKIGAATCSRKPAQLRLFCGRGCTPGDRGRGEGGAPTYANFQSPVWQPP